jgi:aspartate/methionine/tyrosine aminotransferase
LPGRFVAPSAHEPALLLVRVAPMTFTPRLSERTSHLREAGILRQLTLKVAAFSDGINLGQGVCDLDMPEVLREAAVASIRTDRATYTSFAGVSELRKQIARRTKARYGLDYADDEIVVTVGSSMAYSATLMTVCDAGDEIVLFEPFYPYHRSFARLAGAVLRTVRLDHRGVDWDGLERALGPKTRVVVVNTPSNPLGHVWTAAELDRLAGLVARTSALVVTDEIYEDLVYDGRAHVPPATRAGLFERTVTVSGVSKAFSVTGWRLGWLCAPRALAKAIGPVFDVMAVCAPRPLQAAAAVALRDLPETYYTTLRDGYARRRGMLADALRESGFEVREPDGAYYMLANYAGRFGPIPPLDASFRLLHETHVAAIPGDIFFEGASPTLLRFQFAVEEPVIAEVARRLVKARRRS